ncbi:ATP-binding protein [Thermococcus stetteri]|uniref:ATP-binding protein n=1 Tax=Thermococcus stetteri TaxID=49900 RepID=UPI001AE55D0F|nr:ATP-binding protein [Thermococcus stetteri]MBP1910761.1 AAA+ ATPase superfamily predicted ATPase [Thermococcus stetteri]
MPITFIDREKELAFMESLWQKENSFLPIYGRRRVGKTRLVKEFIRGKPSIYYLARNSTYRDNLLEFSRVALEAYPGSYLTPSSFSSFVDVFRYLSEKGKLIVVIDEFPYLIQSEKKVLSEFQYIVDEIVRNSKIHLILVGSSVGMMEEHVLSQKSPLYGRRDGQIRLQPLDFFSSWKLLGINVEEAVRIYGITGGIPAYLLLFNSFEDVKRVVFTKQGFLYAEGDFLLSSELREPRVYKLILKAVAEGRRRFNEISTFTGIPRSNLFKYVEILERLGFLRREVPVTARPKTKNTRYAIADNYMAFYFRFVERYRNEIELESLDFWEEFLEDYNRYLGEVFEGIAREFLLRLNKRGELPFRFTKIGRWWHKGEEIDLVSLNDRERKALFVEVKWKGLEEREARGILKDVERKAELVGLDGWEKRYGLVAKKVERKEGPRKEGWLVWDLEDFERLRE